MVHVQCENLPMTRFLRSRAQHGVAVGGSASARLSLRTEFARTLQNVTFAVLAFLLLPFPRSYFELTSIPSTRTWSPLWRVSASAVARRLNATTRCHSVFDCHSSFASFHDCCVATERTVKVSPLPRTWRFSGSFPRKPINWT